MERDNKGTLAAFISVTTLFFAWGFITSNNDPLIAALRAIFSLSYTQALLTQVVFFAAYFVMSLPAASIINRFGAVTSIIAALGTMVAGCLIVKFAGQTSDYNYVLIGLFTLAAGIATLQVAANPLIAALGDNKSSHFRLVLAQTFNSLGVVFGVHYGSKIMLSPEILNVPKDASGAILPIADAAQKAIAMNAVGHAFSLISISLIILAVFIFVQRKRIQASSHGLDASEDAGVVDGLTSKWAVLGALGIFFYVGAEVSIGSIMINFLNQPNIMNLPLDIAGQKLANLYWGGALIGRIAGVFLLTRLKATDLLAFCAGVTTLLCLVAALTHGPIAGYAALSVGLFNSIMFPTIFTITLERSSATQGSTSGLLCLAIVGGAILPYIVGVIADSSGLTMAFIVPLLAYLYIAIFAVKAKGAKVNEVEEGAAPSISH